MNRYFLVFLILVTQIAYSAPITEAQLETALAVGQNFSKERLLESIEDMSFDPVSKKLIPNAAFKQKLNSLSTKEAADFDNQYKIRHRKSFDILVKEGGNMNYISITREISSQGVVTFKGRFFLIPGNNEKQLVGKELDQLDKEGVANFHSQFGWSAVPESRQDLITHLYIAWIGTSKKFEEKKGIGTLGTKNLIEFFKKTS